MLWFVVLYHKKIIHIHLLKIYSHAYCFCDVKVARRICSRLQSRPGFREESRRMDRELVEATERHKKELDVLRKKMRIEGGRLD